MNRVCIYIYIYVVVDEMTINVWLCLNLKINGENQYVNITSYSIYQVSSRWHKSKRWLGMVFTQKTHTMFHSGIKLAAYISPTLCTMSTYPRLWHLAKAADIATITDATSLWNFSIYIETDVPSINSIQVVATSRPTSKFNASLTIVVYCFEHLQKTWQRDAITISL